MSKVRFRSAVTPLGRRHTTITAPANVDALAAELRPVEPVYCIRPRTLQASARRFIGQFDGDVLYAVKCNPEPAVLRALWRGGVRHFDCASAGEIRLVRQMFPAAHIHYMHPIKPAAAIAEAYGQYGVRNFSLDSEEEVEKIAAATLGPEGATSDLGLFVRLALPKGEAKVDLSGKFGASPAAAVRILRQARPLAHALGICFHVGSQCLDPQAYAAAMALAATIAAEAGVAIDFVDVGGGFPVSYPGETPPALDLYFDAIAQSFRQGFGSETRLMCEPGRAMVAAGASVLVRVEARRGNILHINDGVYGSLADAGVLSMRFPSRAVRPEYIHPEHASEGEAKEGFSFYGPTCDSADFMAGPFELPADIKAGDWIELGQLGAYGPCLRTGFNGFDRMIMAEVTDPPLLATPGHEDVKRRRRIASRPAVKRAA